MGDVSKNEACCQAKDECENRNKIAERHRFKLAALVALPEVKQRRIVVKAC